MKIVIVRSAERTNTVRPRTTLATLHGTRNKPRMPSSVPAALARSEFSTSPRTSRAKLVVMPHDGQGIFVRLWNVQGGRPSCRCVSMRSGCPSSSYGFSQIATAKTADSPSANPTSVPRTHGPITGRTSSGSCVSSILVEGGGTIAISRLRSNREFSPLAA